MKTITCTFGTFVCAFSILVALPAAPAPQPNPVVPVTAGPLFESQRGPHHKTWSRISQFKDAVGRVHTRTNVAYVELATGMHYLEAGAWKESKAQILPGPSGASAPFGVHKCAFANNSAAPGAISLTMADERRLVFNVLGLTYHDTAPSSYRCQHLPTGGLVVVGRTRN